VKTLFLVPNNSQGQNVVRDVLYGAWCSGKLIGGATVPPQSLLSVATVARQAGIDIVFVDALGEGLTLEQTIQRAGDSDVVVVLTSFMVFNEDLRVLRALREARPGLRVILFGAQATFMPELCLNEDLVTAMVMREPEYALRDLLLAWRDDRPWRDLKGVAFAEDGRLQVNEPYPWIKNLDELPIPDRTLLPKGVEYFNPIIEKYPYATMLTSRGCAARCTYCTAPFFMGGRVRARSATSVLEEMEYLAGLGRRTVYFRDEDFVAFRRRNIQICEELIRRRIKLHWSCSVIAGELERDYLALMKRAGLYCLKFGVESGNEEILRKVNKSTNLGNVRRDFALCRAMGVKTHAHCMLGMPGETRRTIEKTFRFIAEIKPTTVTYSVCSPYPGTPLFDLVRERHPEVTRFSTEDLGIQNLHVHSRYNDMFTELTNEEIEAAVQEGYRRFYARPKYIFQSLLRVRSPREFFGLCRTGLNILSFSLSGQK